MGGEKTGLPEIVLGDVQQAVQLAIISLGVLGCPHL